jgi:peptidoglycan L-alanyl-D-glutamate endopeptidase CwlK
VQTLRTFEEQDALYQKGRTRPGPKVTNAKPGTSYHQYGLAIDFCNQINGKLVWKVDKNWMKVVGLYKAAGWSWGGDWKGFQDQPHLEKTFGYHWRDLLKKHQNEEVDKNGYVIIC